jgi:hypothetical protein
VTGQQWIRGIFSGIYRWRNFISHSTPLNYLGTPDPDPCTLPQAADRGVSLLDRQGTGSDELQVNVRQGPEVALRRAGSGPLGVPSDPCVASTFAPVTDCLTAAVTPTFADELRDGLLTSGGPLPGRLIGDCGPGTTNVHGYSDVDASSLFAPTSPLLDLTKGTGTQLRTAVLTGSPSTSTKGWITSRALACGRLAVLPVIDPVTVISGAPGAREIDEFRYVWIDSRTSDRGLEWNGSRLRSISGYVIDPEFLPDLVAGSPVVGPYLGSPMPKEALLVNDLGGPDP